MARILTVTMNPAIDVSASTPRIAPVRKLRCTGLRRDPGGGGINVARVVAMLGGDACAFYPAGGSPGALLTRLLEESGIPQLTVPIAGDTREDFTIREEATAEEYRFVLPGPTVTEAEWRGCLDRLAALPDRPAFIVASGSLPPGVPAEFIAGLAAVARTHEARLVVDSSGEALARALDAGVYLVKPNLGELCALVGRPLETEAEWQEAAAGLVRAGKAQIVVLSLAERGALLVTADGAIRAPGRAVQVVSAVGAGDSFLGALVWSLARDGDLEQALRHAMAAGTAALLTPGTELCRVEDVHRLFAQMQTQPLTG